MAVLIVLKAMLVHSVVTQQTMHISALRDIFVPQVRNLLILQNVLLVLTTLFEDRHLNLIVLTVHRAISAPLAQLHLLISVHQAITAQSAQNINSNIHALKANINHCGGRHLHLPVSNALLVIIVNKELIIL